MEYWTDFTRNPFMWIIGTPEIGEDTWIGPFTVIDGSGSLTIGDHCSVSAGVQIYTHSMLEPGREEGDIERDSVHIGDSVYLGANAVVQKGTVIEEGSIIGAGSVVLSGSHIGPDETWAGVPAERVDSVAGWN